MDIITGRAPPPARAESYRSLDLDHGWQLRRDGAAVTVVSSYRLRSIMDRHRMTLHSVLRDTGRLGFTLCVVCFHGNHETGGNGDILHAPYSPP